MGLPPKNKGRRLSKKYFLPPQRISTFLRKNEILTDLYAKDNPNGFLSHYLSLRKLQLKGFIGKLKGRHNGLPFFVPDIILW